MSYITVSKRHIVIGMGQDINILSLTNKIRLKLNSVIIFESRHSSKITMLRILCFSLSLILVKCDLLDFLSDQEKVAIGKMHFSELPENARRVVRTVTLHGNST